MRNSHFIKAIISGETDPVILSGLANNRVKKSREEIAKALSYNGRKDYMYEFPTAKQWTSWLRLSPNNRKSGGKVLSSHVPKGSNRVATALRIAVESDGKQKNAPLYPFFQRILYRKEWSAAIIATAINGGNHLE